MIDQTVDVGYRDAATRPGLPFSSGQRRRHADRPHLGVGDRAPHPRGTGARRVRRPARPRPAAPVDDDPREGEMALAYHLLRTPRVAPPWIEADKEVRAALDHRSAAGARPIPPVDGRLVGDPGLASIAGRTSWSPTHDRRRPAPEQRSTLLSLHRRPIDRAAGTAPASQRRSPASVRRGRPARDVTTPDDPIRRPDRRPSSRRGEGAVLETRGRRTGSGGSPPVGFVRRRTARCSWPPSAATPTGHATCSPTHAAASPSAMSVASYLAEPLHADGQARSGHGAHPPLWRACGAVSAPAPAFRLRPPPRPAGRPRRLCPANPPFRRLSAGASAPRRAQKHPSRSWTEPPGVDRATTEHLPCPSTIWGSAPSTCVLSAMRATPSPRQSRRSRSPSCLPAMTSWAAPRPVPARPPHSRCPSWNA